MRYTEQFFQFIVGWNPGFLPVGPIQKMSRRMDIRAPHPVSLAESGHTGKETRFSCFNLSFNTFGHYPSRIQVQDQLPLCDESKTTFKLVLTWHRSACWSHAPFPAASRSAANHPSLWYQQPAALLASPPQCLVKVSEENWGMNNYAVTQQTVRHLRFLIIGQTHWSQRCNIFYFPLHQRVQCLSNTKFFRDQLLERLWSGLNSGWTFLLLLLLLLRSSVSLLSLKELFLWI